MNTTPWFHSHVKPVHVGEYEIYKEGIRVWWNGKIWSMWYFRADNEATKTAAKKLVATYPNMHWRGLAEEPKWK